MRFAYKVDIQGISKWTENIAKKGRRHQVLYSSYAIKIIRECLIFNFANKELLKSNDKELKFIQNFSAFINEENSIEMIEKLEKTIKAINRNANVKILFFDLSLKMVKLLKLKPSNPYIEDDVVFINVKIPILKEFSNSIFDNVKREIIVNNDNRKIITARKYL